MLSILKDDPVASPLLACQFVALIIEGSQTYSCLTPMVQHWEGGLDAIFRLYIFLGI
jgi:hypothetical protein